MMTNKLAAIAAATLGAGPMAGPAGRLSGQDRRHAVADRLVFDFRSADQQTRRSLRSSKSPRLAGRVGKLHEAGVPGWRDDPDPTVSWASTQRRAGPDRSRRRRRHGRPDQQRGLPDRSSPRSPLETGGACWVISGSVELTDLHGTRQAKGQDPGALLFRTQPSDALAGSRPPPSSRSTRATRKWRSSTSTTIGATTLSKQFVAHIQGSRWHDNWPRHLQCRTRRVYRAEVNKALARAIPRVLYLAATPIDGSKDHAPTGWPSAGPQKYVLSARPE